MGNDEGGRTAVTVVGLGLMGRALAAALLRAGHRTTVWNRTASKADELLAEGALFAPSVHDAVTAAPLVVFCVSDHDALHDLLAPLDGAALDGHTLVNLTSGTPAQARETAAWAAARGAAYLDGGIMATPQEVGTPAAHVVVCGPRQALEPHRPVLSALAGGTTHLGEDHGLVALHEMAVMALMWSTLNGFLQGAALLGAAGVDAGAFVPYARQGAEAVTGWLADHARQIDAGGYPVLDATLGTHLTSMRNLVLESEALGVSTELPRLVAGFADRAVAGGHGGDSYAALIEEFRNPAPGRPGAPRSEQPEE
nr:NAD(P)-binding domain-containing protein [Streptomyces avicenniae]